MPELSRNQPMTCVVCGAAMGVRLDPQISYCPQCGLWASSFEAGASVDGHVDEQQRFAGLKDLRRQNYDVLLKKLDLAPGATLCDVGCAYGWFLESAAAHGLQAQGIEPDEQAARQGLQNGLKIRVGTFPEVLTPEEKFDLLSFNDVFEHLPDLTHMLGCCRAHLKPGGKLVLNLPSSRGLLFRASCLLARFSMRGPLERLWQKDYPCPHLWYFHSANLSRLVTAHGFRLVHSGSLASWLVRGLWSRLRMDRRSSLAASLVTYAGMLALTPVQQWLGPDILLQIYQLDRQPTT